MKTIKIKAISAVIFLGATVLYGAGNESLYMGNVGRINPATAQVLTGEVQVSGIQSPTKLTLDLVLPNGSLYTVKDISVIKDGTYGVFEFIDTICPRTIYLWIYRFKILKKRRLKHRQVRQGLALVLLLQQELLSGRHLEAP